MLYVRYTLIAIGLISALAGFILMIKTQRTQQKTWSRLLKEDRATAEDKYQELQKTQFAKPMRLCLILILAGMALGAISVGLSYIG